VIQDSDVTPIRRDGAVSVGIRLTLPFITIKGVRGISYLGLARPVPMYASQVDAKNL